MSKIYSFLIASLFITCANAETKPAESAGEKIFLMRVASCNLPGVLDALSYGVNPNVTQDGKTAIDLAGESLCSHSILKVLFENGIDQDPRSLGTRIERLLVGHPCRISSNDEKCDPNMIALFDEILKRGADVNMVSFSKEPLLSTAIKTCRYCLDAMLVKGADPNLIVASAWSPFETLLHMNFKGLFDHDSKSLAFHSLEEMLKAGGNVNYKSFPSALCYGLGISNRLFNLFEKYGLDFKGSAINCAMDIYLRGPIDKKINGSYLFLERVRRAKTQGMDLSVPDTGNQNALIQLIDRGVGYSNFIVRDAVYSDLLSELVQLGVSPFTAISLQGTALNYFFMVLKSRQIIADSTIASFLKGMVTKETILHINNDGDSILMEILGKYPYYDWLVIEATQHAINLGIDLSIRNAHGKTAYSIAMERGLVEAAWIIEKNGGK